MDKIVANKTRDQTAYCHNNDTDDERKGARIDGGKGLSAKDNASRGKAKSMNDVDWVIMTL